MPPGSIWPPVGRPDQGLPPSPGRPDQGLPPVHGRPDHGLPSNKFLVAICAISAGGGLQVIGYTVVDPSLSPGHDLPGSQPLPDQGLPGSQPYPDQGLPSSPGHPDQGLPPFAQPR
jgi:hypothetical protein